MCRLLLLKPVKSESRFSSLLFATPMLTLGVERYRYIHLDILLMLFVLSDLLLCMYPIRHCTVRFWWFYLLADHCQPNHHWKFLNPALKTVFILDGLVFWWSRTTFIKYGFAQNSISIYEIEYGIHDGSVIGDLTYHYATLEGKKEEVSLTVDQLKCHYIWW